MKITKTFVSIFLVTFLIGFVAVPTIKKGETVSIEPTTILLEKMPTPPIETKIEDESNEEYEWEENYDAKFKIKLLETGEFHGDEVKAKSGETWLGLFKQGDSFSLLSTNIKVKRVFDVIIDDEEKGEKTGKGVSVTRKNQPIFLLKNADFLKQGKIKTVFYEFEKSEDSEGIWVDNNFNQMFSLNAARYNLLVTTKKEKGSWIDETSKLVLSDGKTEQIIYSQKRCDDCMWRLIWAGDLDKDGKLDLYLDLHDHYNVMQRRLFLSSQAEEGKLVKEIANFRTVGC